MAGIVLDSTLDPDQDKHIPLSAIPNSNTAETPGWILKIRTSTDLVREHRESESWTLSPETRDGAIIATSKSDLGTYHLIAIPGALSLLLETADKTYDLTNLLEDEKIGPPLTQLSKQWQGRLQREQSLIAQLPVTAALPVSDLQEKDSWLRSSGTQGLYLSYEANDTAIQISCAHPSEEPSTYQVKIRVSPELPWKDVTTTIESTTLAHVAVTELIKKAS